ncbi:MAG: hypothetical protein Q7T69_06465 [Rhodoferax sp.]|nr:hypothetical protein [Rhodoferax sp.]
MQLQTFRLRAAAFVAGVALLAFSGWANADPPSRVARLGYMSGAVSFSPAGETEWDPATINRPLGSGDRLWTDERARAEIQIGGASVRMNGATSVVVLNLDDRIAQLQLTQGTLNVNVRRLAPNQVVEVDTPNLAFTLRKPGAYRIEVDPDGNATDIIVRKGQGEAYGEGAAYVIDARQPYRFMGTGLREYEYLSAPPVDEFDRWASSRDRSYDSSPSARYVSPDVVGYQDLDANGTWRVEPNYGNVWVPNRVATGWAPYRDGHWTWIDPWGWTWVDDAPWGFAVSHYGRWAHMRGTWVWVPGPVRAPAYYAPALVAFVGGSNFQLTISSGNVGGVAWFPLAPREVYRPSYPVSRGYFEQINRSNTVVNTTVINNTYKTYNTTNVTNITNVIYANRVVPGAVIAVPTTTFVQSQPVSKAAVRVSREQLARAAVANVAAVAPTEKSVRGAGGRGERGEQRGQQRGEGPPERVFERPVVARTAPAAAHAGFAAQREQLATKPGRPLDAADRKGLKPAAAAAPAPVVNVVAPAQVAPPTVRPPPAGPAARKEDSRGKSDDRKGTPTPLPAERPPEQRGNADQRGQAVVPPPPRPIAPVPAARSPEQRGRPDQRGNGEQRGQTGERGQQVAPPPPPRPIVAMPAPAAVPQVAPPAATRPPEQRGRPEQRRNGEERGQSAVPPPPAQAAPKEERNANRPRPAASRPGDQDNERKRGEDNRR